MVTIAVDASGPVNATAAAGVSINTGAAFATTSFPDLVVCWVGWVDTNGASVVVTDNTPLTWFPRGPIFSFGSYHIQEWGAIAPAALAAKTVTATFSVATSGRQGIIVCGFSTSALAPAFDTMGGLPNFLPESVTAGTTTYGFLSTHLATDMLIGAILLAPTAVVTQGAGFALLNSKDCTSFRLAVEYKIVTTPQLDKKVNWTFPANTYTAISEMDALPALGASPNDITQTYEGAGDVVTAVWQGS